MWAGVGAPPTRLVCVPLAGAVPGGYRARRCPGAGPAGAGRQGGDGAALSGIRHAVAAAAMISAVVRRLGTPVTDP